MDSPWVIEEDFNVFRFADERNGSIEYGQYRDDFNMVINHLGLIKLPMTNKHYT